MHTLIVIPLSNRHSARTYSKYNHKVAVINPQNVSHPHVFILESSSINRPCRKIAKSLIAQHKDKCRTANTKTCSFYRTALKTIVFPPFSLISKRHKIRPSHSLIKLIFHANHRFISFLIRGTNLRCSRHPKKLT